MKKLFTFLSRANNNSVGISFNHRRVSSIYSILTLMAIMLMVPSVVRGATTTIDFVEAATAAERQAGGQTKYETRFVMSSDYTPLGNGAKVGDKLEYRWNSGSWNRSIDISRLAFLVNTAGVGNADNTGAGFYLRRTGSGSSAKAGLYAGASGNTEFAILDMKPGSSVTIYFTGGSGVYNVTQGQWFTSGQAMSVNNLGDLRIGVTQGTYISSIIINEEIAEYTITTTGNTTTFEFTKNGTLEVNDFALPYLTASFGSTNDYLVVQNLQSHMIKTTGEGAGTETLVTDQDQDWKPVAGSFYAFKPTGGGTITVEGGIQGSCVHLFVYNNGWDGANGYPYKETYYTDDDHYISFSFDVEKNKTYYICINNQDTNEHGNAFHLHKFSFKNTFHLNELAKVVDLDKDVVNGSIQLTKIEGAGGLGDHPVKVKKCTGNIKPNSVTGTIDAYGYLNITKPEFEEGTDEAGTVILTIDTQGGEAAFVVTFPYHANYGYDEATGRSHGHIWNFIDPRLSDSNIGNSWTWDNYSGYNSGTTTGILSLGQYKTPGSDLRKEADNREWTYGWTIKSSGGDITDPMYKNVWDMEGDNADMIWETEGLWFETGTNQSCIYNENDAMDGLGQPTQYWQTMTSDPDRYVGLVPEVPNVTNTQNAPSFTIPGLKDGDRVLIYMKSGEKSGSDREAIFFNIEGALDAVGTPIVSTDLYGAGGTQYHVERYEGCYHFIKDASDTPMKFTMVRGAICKLLYIQIYSGKRIDTNHVERGGNSPLLFLNDEGTAQENAAGGYYNMHYLGKGESIKAQVLTQSGNLTNNGLEASSGTFSTDKFWYFKDSRTLRPANYDKRFVQFKSTVGEFGVFRLRLMDMDFIHDNGATATTISGQGYKYVCDFADRNFTVGYREKKIYPYTWDFEDMQTYSGTKIANENEKYPETTNKYERPGWDISLWDGDGYMIIGNVEDNNNDGDIFSQNKEGFGNQLYADDVIIPETQGLWFYMDSNQSKYNRCAQITSQGLHFVNTNKDSSYDPWWNYKVVVPSVPSDGAVYLRMKRDTRVDNTDKKYSEDDGKNVLFLNTRFAWGTDSKTSLTEDTQNIYAVQENGTDYSFFQVPGTTDEWIVAVKNTTGAVNHLTFTLNGWIVKKVAVSKDEKTVNIKGYATESRGRDIDTKLTSYLTGKDFKTYLVGNPNYSDRTLTLTEVSQNSNYVLPAETGCVLFNSTDENEAKILANGFHLFVPDMHDTEKTATTTGNMLKANLEATSIPATETVNGTDYTNYILTYKYYKLDKDGKKIAGTLNTNGPEIFYRVASGGATGKTNTAYLPLPTASVDPSLATNVQNPAKFTFIFADELFGQSQGITTAVENIDVQKQIMEGSAEWYNMNGQKLNGKPTASGLYIINGKKVLVK